VPVGRFKIRQNALLSRIIYVSVRGDTGAFSAVLLLHSTFLNFGIIETCVCVTRWAAIKWRIVDAINGSSGRSAQCSSGLGCDRIVQMLLVDPQGNPSVQFKQPVLQGNVVVRCNTASSVLARIVRLKKMCPDDK
jgi:hypothetical protein